jgi:hypothetical protein
MVGGNYLERSVGLIDIDRGKRLAEFVGGYTKTAAPCVRFEQIV